MKGLLLKDFYMLTKYCRAFLLVLGVFLAVSCFGAENTFFLVYPVLIAGMIPVTLISYDEREKWNIYCETLPCTRAQFVSGKYLMGLLFELGVFLLSGAAQAIRMIRADEFAFASFLPSVLAIFVTGLIGPSLFMPFIFRFGAEKGRLANYIAIGAMCACATIFSRTGLHLPTQLRSEWAMLLIFLLAIAVFLCSWGISIFLYKKREL